ncbi:MAG: MFS transporter [Planctomycetes bacterium]|nr:MFS transporter [Planctomycetota bacterium]
MVASPGSNAPLSLGQKAGLFRRPGEGSLARTFLLLCILFLLSGVCNSMLDTLNRHFQNSFAINKMRSALVQNAFYLGYFFMALPAGMLARRLGYKGGMVIGLGVITLGALWFIPATRIGTFGAFLAGLFILAAGFTCLETIANPYATVLGPRETAAARINLAQSCNGIGWMLGPATAGYFIFSSTAEVNRSNDALYLPYLLLGFLAGAMLVVIGFSRVPDLHAEEEQAARATQRPSRPLRRRWHFTLAIAAQFCYVAAQTGVFSYFINYVVAEVPPLGPGWAAHLPGYMTALQEGHYRLTDRGAATLLSVGGFGLFLLGRLTGSLALGVLRPHRLLAAYSALNTLVMLAVVLPLGWFSVGALFLSFFLMLGEQTKRASSFLVMAILGGAFMPMLMGWLADHGGMRAGFLMPMVLFALIAAYGLAWPRLEALDRDD